LPRQISPEKVGEYLGLRLEGYNNKEASSGAGISSRTGSNYLKRFREEVKRGDIVSIAKSYGLDIDDVFKLTGELKEKNFTVGKCEIGYNIVHLLAGLGIEVESFEAFVKNFFVEAQKLRMSGTDLAVSLREVHDIRKEHGISFNQASKRYQELIDNKKKIEEDIRNTENKLKIAKQNLNEGLKSARTTSEEINKFKKTKSSLHTFGVPVDDYNKLPTLISNLSSLSNESKLILDFYSSYKDLEKMENELKESVGSLSSNESRLSNEIKRLEAISEEKKEYLNSLRLLQDQSLTPENTRILMEAISALGHKYGLTPQESIERLTVELNAHFIPLLSFGDEVTRRKKRVQVLSLQIGALEEDVKIQTGVYESRKKELDALKLLNHAGVEDKDLISWRIILHKIDLDPTGLKTSMERMGSLEAIMNKKTEDLRDLEDRISQATKVKSQLESNLKILTSDTVQEVKENLARFKEILNAFEDQFLSEETGFNAETKSILDESRNKIIKILDNTETSWDKKLNDLSTQLDTVINEVQETRDLAYKTGQEVGQYSTINMLSKLIRGEPVERNQALGSMHAITSNFESWAQHNQTYVLHRICRELSSEITRLMTLV
jgi:DNA repair exonuclease SbcCD ATPase subunit